MQQPMYLPNGYMMTYYPQMPPGNMPMYGMENGVQGRTTYVLFRTNVPLATLLQKPLLVPNTALLPNSLSVYASVRIPVTSHFFQGSLPVHASVKSHVSPQ